jgi:hypothetical protein
LEKNAAFDVASVESTDVRSLSQLTHVSGGAENQWKLNTYHSIVDGFPALVFQLLCSLDKQLPILWGYKSQVDQILITGLIDWYKRELLCFGRIHVIDIDVDEKVSVSFMVHLNY